MFSWRVTPIRYDPNEKYWQPRDVHHAARLGHAVGLRCPACGHEVIHDPYALWWYVERRQLPQKFVRLRLRFYCAPCFKRHRRKVHPEVAVVWDAPTSALPRPPESEWKRSVRRMRS